MQLSKPMISAIFISLLFAIVSIIYYPTSPGGSIYVTASKNITFQWDNGYGFNKAQTSEVLSDCQPQQFENLSLCNAHNFHYWAEPERVKFTDAQDIEAYVIYKNSPKLHRVNLSNENAGLMPQAPQGFNRINLVLFPFGIFLIGLITYLISLNLNLSYNLYEKKLHYFFLTTILPYLTLSGLMWFIFPGRLNPFNPLGIVNSSAAHYLTFQDSVLLQLIWGGLYSVIESPFFILTFQAIAFLSCLLLLWHKWPEKKISLITILLLVFNPVSIFYYGFLERSIANAYVFCLTIIVVVYLKIRPTNKLIHFGILTTLCITLILLRMDNIIFVITLILIFYFNKKYILLIAVPVALLSFSFIYSNFDLKHTITKNHSILNYINISLADSVARLYINKTTAKLSLLSQENNYFQSSLDFEYFPSKVDAHFDIHKVYPINSRPMAFLRNSLSLISKMPYQFLYIRALVAKKAILHIGDDGWNMSTTDPNLFNLNFYMADPINIGTNKGHNTHADFFIVNRMHGYLFIILILSILLIGLALWFKLPVSGKLSLLVTTKLITISLVIPTTGGRYMYEILLAVLVLPMIFWAEKQIVKKIN